LEKKIKYRRNKNPISAFYYTKLEDIFPHKKTAPEIPGLSACSGLVPVCGYFPSSSNRLVHPTIEITGVLSLLIKDSNLGSGKPEKLPAIILRLKNRYIFPDCRVVFLLIGRREIYENAHI